MIITLSKRVCVLFVVSCTCLFQVVRTEPTAEWTILNYIEADNNIERHGLGNIYAMQKVGSTDKVNILVQLDDAHFAKTWRYKIIKNGIEQNVTLNQEMGLDPEKELTDSMTQWALPTYPAKRLMLVLWNHGNGILDEPSERAKFFKDQKKRTARGILYNYPNHTFLDNQQLDRALGTIVAQNNGKKIDIIGMDACLMAMLEVAYQIKYYANYFVASENVERVPGWNYTDFLAALIKRPDMSPLDLVRQIVVTFARFNGTFQSFTQSAVQLDKIETVKKDVDTVLQAVGAYKRLAPTEIKSVILAARRATPEFYRGRYIDLGCFYKNMLRSLTGVNKEGQLYRGHVVDTPYSRTRKALQDVLKEAIRNIKAAVLVCKNGRNYAAAQGISIYYPRLAIHPSYALTKFAQDTGWLDFIAEHKKKP